MQKMTVKLLILLMSIIVVLLMGKIISNKETDSDRDYIVKVCDLWLPNDTKMIRKIDNSETFILAIFEIPKHAEADLLRKNSLTNPAGFNRINVNRFALPESMRNVPTIEGNFGKSGRNKVNTWELLYEVKSGKLWCLVKYPDMSGLSP